jgi:hypothetical protein
VKNIELKGIETRTIDLHSEKPCNAKKCRFCESANESLELAAQLARDRGEHHLSRKILKLKK